MARFIVIEPGLVSRAGHHLNNMLGFRQAGAELGLATTIYVSQIAEPSVVELLDAKPLLPVNARKPGDAEDLLDVMGDCAVGLRPFWLDTTLTAEDIVLFAFAEPGVLYGFLQWLRAQAPAAIPATFIRFLGMEYLDLSSGEYNANAFVFRFLSRMLAGTPADNRVFYTTNSERLLPRLTMLSGRRAFLMPMPKYYGGATATAPEPPAGTTIYVHVAYWRGIVEAVLEAAEACLDDRPGVRFVIRFCAYSEGLPPQSSSPDRSDGRLRIIADEQTTDAYLRTIAESDIVVLPYRPTAYRVLNSGVFCEAAAFGKIAVVPASTRMADQIEAGRAAGIIFSSLAAADLMNAFTEAIDRRRELAGLAHASARQFQAENSCRRNLEMMLALNHQEQSMRVNYVLGNQVDFLRTNVSRQYLAEGFGINQPGEGVWTVADRAVLVLEIGEEETRELILSMELVAFVADAHPEISVDVVVNDRAVDTWQFAIAAGQWMVTTRSALLPAEITAARELRIELRIRQPASPAALGIAADTRRLGVLLRSLLVSAR